MGLDQYLYASKNYADDDPIAAAIAAIVTDPARAGEYDKYRDMDDPAYHRAGYEFVSEVEREAYREILALAGAQDMACPHSPSLNVEVAPGVGVKLSLTSAYWRKVNAVHAWLVEECQGGVDECQESDPIDTDKLRELRTLAHEAQEYALAGDSDSARSTLSPQSGFFFGSTEIDEWYAGDMGDTVLQLDRVLNAEAANPGWTFTYRSSW